MTLIHTTGAKEFLGPETGDRRWWPMPDLFADQDEHQRALAVMEQANAAAYFLRYKGALRSDRDYKVVMQTRAAVHYRKARQAMGLES